MFIIIEKENNLGHPVPACCPRSKHLRPAILVKSHSELGQVPDLPAVSVPGAAHVEHLLVLDTNTARQVSEDKKLKLANARCILHW